MGKNEKNIKRIEFDKTLINMFVMAGMVSPDNPETDITFFLELYLKAMIDFKIADIENLSEQEVSRGLQMFMIGLLMGSMEMEESNLSCTEDIRLN